MRAAAADRARRADPDLPGAARIAAAGRGGRPRGAAPSPTRPGPARPAMATAATPPLDVGNGRRSSTSGSPARSADRLVHAMQPFRDVLRAASRRDPGRAPRRRRRQRRPADGAEPRRLRRGAAGRGPPPARRGLVDLTLADGACRGHRSATLARWPDQVVDRDPPGRRSRRRRPMLLARRWGIAGTLEDLPSERDRNFAVRPGRRRRPVRPEGLEPRRGPGLPRPPAPRDGRARGRGRAGRPARAALDGRDDRRRRCARPAVRAGS